jgi:uncharacterized membrane protein
MENEEVTPDLLEDIIDSQKQILKELNALKYGDKGATFGEKMSDTITSFMGSWKFIIIQSFILLLWIIFNVIAISFAFDLYPFILLNLVLSFQAAFATPIILMASNRSEQKDRRRAADAYRAIEHIEGMMERMVGSCKELYNEVNGKDE